jgi:hypothetical protein
MRWVYYVVKPPHPVVRVTLVPVASHTRRWRHVYGQNPTRHLILKIKPLQHLHRCRVAFHSLDGLIPPVRGPSIGNYPHSHIIFSCIHSSACASGSMHVFSFLCSQFVSARANVRPERDQVRSRMIGQTTSEKGKRLLRRKVTLLITIPCCQDL